MDIPSVERRKWLFADESDPVDCEITEEEIMSVESVQTVLTYVE